MPNEVHYQGEICKSFNSKAEGKGAWAKKMSNRFLVGIPDLFIADPLDPILHNYPSLGYFNEVKVMDMPRKSGRFKIEHLTVIQAKTLRDLQRARQDAKWTLILRHGPGHVRVIMLSDPGREALTTEELEEWSILRSPGKETWADTIRRLRRQVLV